MNFTAGTLASMRVQDAEAIKSAYKGKGGEEEIRRQLATQIAAIKQSPQTMSSMHKEVMDMLGIDPTNLSIDHSNSGGVVTGPSNGADHGYE